MPRATLAPPRQPRERQQCPHRARRRPRNVRMIQLQTPLQLLRTPRRLITAQRHDRFAFSFANSLRATMRRMAPLGQPRRSLQAPARQHLIARLAADAELTTQLRHRLLASLVGHAKPRLLLHRTGLRPNHRSNLPASSDHLDLLPILPVYSVTHHAGSDPPPTPPRKGEGSLRTPRAQPFSPRHQAVSSNSSRPISQRRISLVPAPIS